MVSIAGSGAIGQKGKNVDGPANFVPIGYPGAIAVNSKNAIYFVDKETDSIRKVFQGTANTVLKNVKITV